MPYDDEDIDAMAVEESGKDAQVREQQIAGAIPMATEPLQPAAVNALAKITASTMEALAGHKVDLPVVTVAEPVEQVPPALGKQIVALQAMVTKLAPQIPELEPYADITVDRMVTNTGLRELTRAIGKMGSDKKLGMAMRAPARGKPKGEPAPEPEPAPMPEE